MRLRERLVHALKLERFFVGEPPQAGPVDLHRRRVYILPTRTGLGFAVLLVLLLLGSVNYGNSLGFMLTFLLFGMAWAAMHHTYRNLVRLQISAGPAEPVFAGSHARFSIELEAPDGGPPRYALQLHLAHGGTLAVDVAGARQVVVEQPAPRRGWLPFERLTIDTRYPLGLFRAWGHVALDWRCLVYPRPAPPGAAPPEGTSDAALAGEHGREGDDFSGFRGYQPGDAPRHVYWKGVARTYTMLTKQFGGDQAEEVWLDWEQTAGDDEERLARLCRWALDAESEGATYGLRLPGREIGPGQGDAQLHRCLAELALYGAPGVGR